MSEPGDNPLNAVSQELSQLRERVTGVRGSLIAGVDGLLITQDGATGPEPYDLAALAAAAYGIGHRTGHVLKQGGHRASTIHSRDGYYTIYSINDHALLAVIGEAGLNIARLHIEAKSSVERLDPALRAARDQLALDQPRL